MHKTKLYSVNGTRYQLEVLPDGLVSIWDTGPERESDNGENEEPHEKPNPSVVAIGLTEGEAFDWLAKKLGLDRPFIPVTRIR